MKRSITIRLGIIAAIVCIASVSFAQRNCGTDAYWAQMLQDNPKNAVTRDALEQSIQHWIQNNAPSGVSSTSKKVIYTIPTVVHVVYNTGTQNISDAQVFSQMDVLNEDFRRTNADASNTPSWFQGVAADSEIEFCLAQQDPSGNASNGITRTSTTTTSFNNDAVKSDGSGGKSPWPRADYLNIWVCPLGGGLLGYATFPGGPAASDGVVIGYNYFGRIGAISPPFDKGRTTTHEVGHWLALFHSFEGGCSGTTSANCATNGDRCCDVPPTSSSNGGCPSNNQNTCTETPTDMNDMHMNYMDYTNDACMNLFTLDQKARMVAVMTGSRASLQNSQGCVSVNLNALDAGISLIISPTGTTCATSISPVVTIENFGLNTLTTATINYDIDGGANNTYSWTGSLTTGQTQDVTLPGMTVTAGTHTFNSNTSSPNGSTDQDGTNDAASVSFTISGPNGAPLPFTEGFEGTTFPPTDWVLDNPQANSTFTRETTASGFGNSTACAKMDFYSATEDITGQSDYLYTLDIDFSSASSPTVMDWNLAYARYEPGNEDSLIILASTDCGATWVRVWQNGDSLMTTNGGGDETTAWTPSNTQWSAESVNLDAFIGFGTVQIQFHALSGWGNNLYLDDINIYSGGGGAAPIANFTANSTNVCVGSTVSFSDLSTNSPTSWSWTFTGGSPGSSTAQNPSVTYNAAGTYAVTLMATNGNGSDTKTTASYITVNANPSATMNSTIAGCGACDGSATAAGTGGASPYAYSWNTSPPQNTATANNLCAGSYSVIITDANGCTGNQSTIVGSSGGVSSTATATDANCGGCDGTGTASGSGGTTPYSYLWSDGSSNANASNLCPGTYTVTVTDAVGCSSTSSITIGPGVPISASTVSNNTSCSGSCDGSATATGIGGTSPYNFTWNTSPIQNAGTATGLCAGSYTVTVTDAAGCTATSIVTVSNGPSMTISVVGTDASCNSVCDGIASANAIGGTAPFSYYWNSSPSQSGATATGLCSGTYGVNITDANGCSTSDNITIAEPAAMVVSATGTAATCGSSDGSATASASNGTPPYNYNWSNGQTTAQATGLAAGVYNVTVTDASGCSQVASTAVDNLNAPATSSTATDVDCNGGNNGTAFVTATGGLPPYSYSWNNAVASTTSSVNGLSAGTYTVEVTDGAGCISTEFVTIFEPTALAVSMSYLQASDNTACDGSANAFVLGGTGPYFYQWNDPASQTTATASGLCMGIVNLTVTDGNGCTSVGSIYVDSIVMSVQEIVATLDIAVYPNPTSGEVNVRFSNSKGKHLQVSVFDLAGKLLVDEVFGRFDSDTYTIDLSERDNGIYFIRVIEDNSFVITKKISLIK
ncbi:MAG: T9SS type A sorting domain-containing protein [Flavobacteriales bacterium]|nr:T9SS type A sorting domain-containing protein [Flavobacteriales bacterium]